jgi:hypothetical protein
MIVIEGILGDISLLLSCIAGFLVVGTGFLPGILIDCVSFLLLSCISETRFWVAGGFPVMTEVLCSCILTVLNGLGAIGLSSGTRRQQNNPKSIKNRSSLLR